LTDFETADGRWLRVQGAFPTERKRLAKVLGTSVDLSEVAAAVRKYPGEEIEQKLVDAKTTVALSRTIAEWLTHPAGRAVRAEPWRLLRQIAARGSQRVAGPLPESRFSIALALLQDRRGRASSLLAAPRCSA
jgi:CO/xanthine dehydrogenase Mo-binding subunit